MDRVLGPACSESAKRDRDRERERERREEHEQQTQMKKATTDPSLVENREGESFKRRIIREGSKNQPPCLIAK